MLIIAHRGASGYRPENTLSAFNLAFSQGADGIEFDVVQVQGKSAIIHDCWLERTTNGSGSVMATPWDQLRMLDAGQGESIPCLQEVLSCLPTGSWCNIELKSLYCVNSWISEFGTLLKQFPQHVNNIVLSSFHHPWVKAVGAHFPQVKHAFLIAHYPLNLTAALGEFTGFAVNIELNLLDKAIVDAIHAHNKQVWVFTVNHVEDMQRCKAFGVDAIFTNYPDIALAKT